MDLPDRTSARRRGHRKPDHPVARRALLALVAAFCDDHPRHYASLRAFAAATPRQAACAAHTLAEVYSVLTRLPLKPIITAEQAMLFVQTVREHLTIVGLDPVEYSGAIEQTAAHGVSGDKIYDALIARCAIKSRAETTYTWNVADFSSLAGATAGRIRTP